MNYRVTSLTFIGLLVCFCCISSSEARFFRTSMMPNGTVLGCGTCHLSEFGAGPRNPFGEAVAQLVSVGGREDFWSPALAMMDSDGDGFTNGEEVMDPEGTWQEGDPNPGDPNALGNPGNPDSLPAQLGDPDALVAILFGANEVPGVETLARGIALLRLSADGTQLDYWIQLFDIDGVTNSHIHLGTEDEIGPVVFPLEIPVTGFSSGTIGIDAERRPMLFTEEYYVNIHTEEFPAGEVRGQIVDRPIEFVAELSGDEEVPPVVTDGSGMAMVTVSEDLESINWTVTVQGVDDVTMAHFHEAPRGENGPVLIPIASEFFTESTGESAITEEFLLSLLAETIYVNVHSATVPSGEVRGQLMFDEDIPLPVTGVEFWELMH